MHQGYVQLQFNFIAIHAGFINVERAPKTAEIACFPINL